MASTGTFYDIDPEGWKELIDDALISAADGGTTDSVPDHRGDELRGPEEPIAAPAPDPTQYWTAALTVVNAWSRYQAAKKMEINARYKETEHKVKEVVSSYWEGKKDLQSSVLARSERVDEVLKYFAAICDKYGVEPVSRNWLYQNLHDAAEYASLREKISRRLDKAKAPQSLKDL